MVELNKIENWMKIFLYVVPRIHLEKNGENWTDYTNGSPDV